MSVEGVAVAPDGTVWAAESNPQGSAGSLVAFAPNTSGTLTPEYDITGVDTGLEAPEHVTVDSSGNIWVADNYAEAIYEFAAGSDGDVPPIETINFSNDYISGVAIGSDGYIYAAAFNEVDVFAPGASGFATPVRTITNLGTAEGIALQPDGTIVVATESNIVETFAADATGNATPIYKISGPNTGLDQTYDATVAVDPGGEIYVGNGESGTSVTEYAQDATGNSAPIATLTGASTGLLAIADIAVDSSGQVYVAQYPANATAANTISIFGPMLTVSSVSPNNGPLAGGQSVTITGSSFLGPPMSVNFGGVAATDIQLINPTTITAVVPPGVANGVVDVLVGQNDGAQTATLAGGYTYGPVASPATSHLPTTGVDLTPGIVAGAVLLGIGGMLLVIRRRFTRRPVAPRG